jgi:[acyl-carrier-protein] S-malonyltransferase
MKDGGGWLGRISHRSRVGVLSTRRPRLEQVEEDAGAHVAAQPTISPHDEIKKGIGSAAFAFRGYDVSNLGRSQELLDHPKFGPVVSEVLAEASAITADTLKEPVDLALYIRANAPTALVNFPLDVALIVSMEMAQVRLLEKFFDVPVRDAKLSFGYSIGELAALVLGGSFSLTELLPLPLALSEDAASLAEDVTMGILFTRSPILPEADVLRLCAEISNEGQGLVAPSTFLSPNTTLLLGQGKTIDRVEALMKDYLPPKVMLRRNPNRWPPLHTPLVRSRNIPNRTAMALYAIKGSRPLPRPPVISCATGKFYDVAHNSRETLIQWTERPQRLWDAIDATLYAGVESVIHVGPAPNLIPATFSRLVNNVNKHLGNKYVRGFVSGMHRHSWIAAMLPHRAALLRAPFVKQIILEDWLLENGGDTT